MMPVSGVRMSCAKPASALSIARVDVRRGAGARRVRFRVLLRLAIDPPRRTLSHETMPMEPENGGASSGSPNLPAGAGNALESLTVFSVPLLMQNNKGA